MNLFAADSFAGHEQVVFASDPDSGLRAIIAIHDTTLGPSLGGCRIWNYRDEAAAIADVMLLSQAMTYKAAMADLPFGGGKSVILVSPERPKTREMMISMGMAIERLGGRYIAGEDVGSTPEDMTAIGTMTSHVLGKPEEEGGSGDSSPMAALGCFFGIAATASYRFAESRLIGLRVAVQGLGKVGAALCGMLREAGADLVVADIDQARQDEVVRTCGAKPMAPDKIHAAEVDVFAPCAFGGGLNRSTIPQIKAAVVAGAANNQLVSHEDGKRLSERGILYAPDYVINAGGMIQLAVERLGGGRDEAERRVRRIGESLLEVYQYAREENVPTNVASDRLAATRIAAAAAR